MNGGRGRRRLGHLILRWPNMSCLVDRCVKASHTNSVTVLTSLYDGNSLLLNKKQHLTD